MTTTNDDEKTLADAVTALGENPVIMGAAREMLGALAGRLVEDPDWLRNQIAAFNARADEWATLSDDEKVRRINAARSNPNSLGSILASVRAEGLQVASTLATALDGTEPGASS